MKLYTNPASPFCRKVEVLLHEIGQTEAAQPTVVAGHPTDPGTMPTQQNPIGKIPTLEDKGRALYDSRVITRYLDTKFGAGLYPEATLFDILTLEATADGIAEAAVLMVYEGRSRPEDKYDEITVEAQWTRVARALDHLEATAMSLLDTPLHMGQIAVASALGYLDFRHRARDWRATRPNLAQWYAEFAKRPSMQATEPPA